MRKVLLCLLSRTQGAAALVCDPVPGDIGLAVFCQRDVSNVVNGTPEPVQPGSFRNFDISDGFFIGGFLNQQPTCYIQILPDGKGLVVFYEVPTNTDISYTVIASGYADYTGSVNIAPGEYGWVNVEMAEPVLTFIVKDRETGVGIANAYVYLRDGNHQMLMQLGITDSNGILTLSGLTLEPGEYYSATSAARYNVLLLGYLYTVVDSSPITATITFELQKGFVLPST